MRFSTGAVAVVSDDGDDRRSRLRRSGRRRLALAVAEDVGFRRAVVRQPEEIAVAAETGSERRRDLEAVHLGTEQDLGGIDGAGGENHVGGIECERFARDGEVTCWPWMRQPPVESFSIHSTLVCVKISAPFFAASGR